jgi:hypothetical protein
MQEREYPLLAGLDVKLHNRRAVLLAAAVRGANVVQIATGGIDVETGDVGLAADRRLADAVDFLRLGVESPERAVASCGDRVDVAVRRFVLGSHSYTNAFPCGLP